ncbi:alpha/beta hydrolase, partial [Campylobacter sp. RM9344]|nr:hypothetical protein [Campylobacter sp. RM6914]MBE2985508.1 alpha/beta hydrolase [Campylobacter sp. RM6883]MBE2989042.1 alpha/beta hydrolase [Campylobacter sp. RM12920]MBE3030358.1 alpha/beta hydrolase [Campylobacter sp. RM9344]MBE3608894.1 alpha/beta hydrolase [Campylobacter sp. RM9337]QCD50670.1 hypothetical protein CCAL_0759 [Campylobacter sp. RM6914]
MKSYLKCLMLFVVMMPCLSLNAQTLSINHKDTEVIDVKIEKSEIEMISNLVYAQPPIYGYKNKALEMDIIKPVSKELLPTVVFVPGGGFVS